MLKDLTASSMLSNEILFSLMSFMNLSQSMSLGFLDTTVLVIEALGWLSGRE